MRVVKNIFFLIAVFILCFSCDDDVTYGDPQAPVISSTSDLFYIGGVLDVGIFNEMGCTLEFLRPGRITQLVVFMPDNGLYRVTLWDDASGTPITSVNITAEEARPAFVDIPHYMVNTGDRLVVSVYSEDAYLYRPEDAGRPIYPVTTGDVRILSYSYVLDPDGFVLPDHFDFFALEGIADVIFEPEL